MALPTFLLPAISGGRAIAVLATWLVGALLYAFSGGSRTEVSFALASDRTGVVQVFFDMGQGYTEDHSDKQPLKAGVNTYRFKIPDGTTRSIRIDPATTTGVTGISALTILRDGRPVQTIPTTNFVGANQIELLGSEREMMTIRIPDDAYDPQIGVKDSGIAPVQSESDPGAYLFVFIIISLCVFYAGRQVGTAMPSGEAPAFRWGGPMAVFALGLMAAMAFVSASDKSVHPDEFSHVTAARYYAHNWLPPRIGDPESLPSYSAYGASYLNEFDVVYLLAAKFTSVIAPLFAVNDVILYRLFNLLLFLPVIGILFSNSRRAWIAFPLLLTPQVWYIYSYFNADAFAMTIALLFAWQVAKVMESSETYPSDSKSELRFVLTISLLIALTLLSKLNFVPLIYLYVSALVLCARSVDWRIILASGIGSIALVWIYFTAGSSPAPGQIDLPFIGASILLLSSLFIAAILAWRAYQRGDASRRFISLTIVAIVLGAGLAAIRPAIDSYIDGSWTARKQNLSSLTEQLAGSAYKPSTTSKPDWQSPTLYLRKQGVPLGEVIFSKNWATLSVASSFGLYGYMNIIAPNLFYSVLRACFGLIFLIAAIKMFTNERLKPVAIASTIAAVIIVLDSLLTSWIRDFQAQGRYLFPLLCILGFMLYTLARFADPHKLRLSNSVINGAALLAYAFSAASFLFVALRMIEKG